jgi:hypothetical protein
MWNVAGAGPLPQLRVLERLAMRDVGLPFASYLGSNFSFRPIEIPNVPFRQDVDGDVIVVSSKETIHRSPRYHHGVV